VVGTGHSVESKGFRITDQSSSGLGLLQSRFPVSGTHISWLIANLRIIWVVY
jgi:hypothetical protein